MNILYETGRLGRNPFQESAEHIPNVVHRNPNRVSDDVIEALIEIDRESVEGHKLYHNILQLLSQNEIAFRGTFFLVKHNIVFNFK